MSAIVICIPPRGHKTWQTQCLHRLCVEIGPPMPQTHFKMRRCWADPMFCSGGTFFDKSIKYFTKSDVFFIKIAKSMLAIVICIASRGHETWKTQYLHRLCVEIGPSMPKTYFQMRRCCTDLKFRSGWTYFIKSLEHFMKSDGFS